MLECDAVIYICNKVYSMVKCDTVIYM